MKLTKAQGVALAERIYRRAEKEAKKYNEEIKNFKPQLTTSQNNLVDDALKHFDAIPDIFIDFFVGGFNGNKRPTRENLIEALSETLDKPERKEIPSQKSIHSKIILSDLGKFNSIEELETSIDPFD